MPLARKRIGTSPDRAPPGRGAGAGRGGPRAGPGPSRRSEGGGGAGLGRPESLPPAERRDVDGVVAPVGGAAARRRARAAPLPGCGRAAWRSQSRSCRRWRRRWRWGRRRPCCRQGVRRKRLWRASPSWRPVRQPAAPGDVHAAHVVPHVVALRRCGPRRRRPLAWRPPCPAATLTRTPTRPDPHAARPSTVQPTRTPTRTPAVQSSRTLRARLQRSGAHGNANKDALVHAVPLATATPTRTPTKTPARDAT